MLNYDACVRLVELHCRRAEEMGSVGDGEGVGGGGGESAAGLFLAREKSIKMWLLEQPFFASRDLNRWVGGLCVCVCMA